MLYRLTWTRRAELSGITSNLQSNVAFKLGQAYLADQDAASTGGAYALTKRWIDVKWDYKEPEPSGACTGFEVAIYAGPDIENGQLAEPITAVPSPGARRYLGILELKTNCNLRAAVRACYGDARSRWTDANASAAFVPDAPPSPPAPAFGENGWADLGNGLIMQWMQTGSFMGATAFTWPKRFPSACIIAFVSNCSEGFGRPVYVRVAQKTASGCTIAAPTLIDWSGGPEQLDWVQATIVAFGY